MESKPIDSTLYARQQIFDRELAPAGEELLYRERPYPNRAPSQFDPDRATSRVLVNAFMRDPCPTFGATRPAFVNFSAATLARDLPFPTDRLVIEVLESVQADDAILCQLERFKRRGFRIALDDYARHDAEHPLIDHADIVKLEYPAFKAAGLHAVIARLKQRKPELQVLVEKIETPHDLETARAAGSDLLQGYGLHQPEPVLAPVLEVPPGDVCALRAALADDDPTRLPPQLACHPILVDHLGRLAAHHRPGWARKPLDCRQTIEIIQSAALGAALDFIEAARPPRHIDPGHRQPTHVDPLHPTQGLSLRSTLAGMAPGR